MLFDFSIVMCRMFVKQINTHTMKTIQIFPSGHGHWTVSTTHYGKKIQAVTTDSVAIDYAGDGEKWAINKLRNFVILNK